MLTIHLDVYSLAEAVDRIWRLEKQLRFHTQSKRLLWAEVFDELARRIKDRFDAERGGYDVFAPNRGAYGVAKRALGIPVGVGMKSAAAAGFRRKGGRWRGPGGKFASKAQRAAGMASGDMAQFDNFLGTVEYGPGDEITWLFGADPFNERKGMWFQWGSGPAPSGQERSGAKGQPPRPFWELTEDDEQAAYDRLAAEVEYILEEF